jgi:hypothetical protein
MPASTWQLSYYGFRNSINVRRFIPSVDSSRPSIHPVRRFIPSVDSSRPSIHPVRRFIPSVSSVVLFTPRHKCLSWVVATEDLVRMKWEWGKNLSNNGIAPTRRQNNSHEEATRGCQAWKCGCQWKLSTKMWFEMPSISAPILRRFSVLAA